MAAHRYTLRQGLLLAGAFVLLLIFFFLLETYAPKLSNTPQKASASCDGGGDVPSTLSGFAWSDTIGWICIGTSDCPNTGVTINSDGRLVGWAWSDNVGWIKFGGLTNSTMPTGGGTQQVNARIVGDTLIGWVKALSADGNGWDGWISFKGSGYGPTLVNGAYTTGPITGYAWGGEVVGWIDASQLSVNNPNPIGIAFDPSFTANPTRIRKGNTVSLSWVATCMTSCVVTDQNGTTVPNSNVTSATNLPSLPIMQKTIYTLTCIDSDDEENTSQIIVSPVPTVREI